MALYLTLPRAFHVNSAGQPYAAAKLYTYRAGTTTALAVYTTAALSVAHSQPVEADANGIFPAIYVDPNSGYDMKIVLKTSGGGTLYTEDNIPSTQTGFSSGAFSGNVTLSSSEPRLILSESDQGSNAKKWDMDVAAAVLKIRTRTDADGTGKDVLAVTRGSGTAVSAIAIGNATDAPAVSVNGQAYADTTGSFTGTLTGVTTIVTGTIHYTQSGRLVSLTFPAAMMGTSNATACTVTGLPTALKPARDQCCPIVWFYDNTAVIYDAQMRVQTDGVIVLYKAASATGFTGSGTKGFTAAVTVTYGLA